MKGVVFTEFLELVEDKWSYVVADRIISASNLPSRGAYTSVGTYDHDELIQLVTNLGKETGHAVPDLIRAFGTYLFERFVVIFPDVFVQSPSLFEFLESVHKHIHVEVRKLYPDAELPSFEYDSSVPGRLVMDYHSSRPFADLAEGLIVGAIQHFGENIDLQREDLPATKETAVRFVLTRTG